MPSPDSQRQAQLRALIQTFLTERLNGKLEALKPDDPKRTAAEEHYSFANWIDNAAKRSTRLQFCVTHTLKPIHAYAKGTSLGVVPSKMARLDVIGSHCLGEEYAEDVVGDAAALDVYQFLKLAHEGRTLLELVLAQDADLQRAFSSNQDEARQWMDTFATQVRPRGAPATHGYAKQLYWCVGDGTDADVRQDDHYHLLAPLFASALAHRVWQTLQEHRFGDTANDARHARKDGQFSDTPVHEYPHLAVRKMGGTKPLNISQLNSERGGNNPLLASLPPLWQTREQAPHTSRRLMARFGYRPEVKLVAHRLRAFLESNPPKNLQTRQRRDAMVFELLDEWMQFSATVRTLTPGWSQAPACSLSAAQKNWLDPEGVAQAATQAQAPAPDADDTFDAIAEDFARWLNGQLRDPLPLGDPEFLHWRKLAREDLAQDAWVLEEAADVC